MDEVPAASFGSFSRQKNNPAGFGPQEKNPQNLKPIYPAGLIYWLYSKTAFPCNTKNFLSEKKLGWLQP